MIQLTKYIAKSEDGSMKNYVEFGKELYLEHAKAIPYDIRDLTMAHMHPNYELLLLLDRVPYSAIINGKIIRETGPVAMIIAPYCIHFTYYLDRNAKDKYFSAFYIGEDYMKDFPESIVPIKTLIGKDQAIIFNLNGYEDKIKKVMEPVLDLHKEKKNISGHFYRHTDIKQRLMFGVIINMLFELSKETKALKYVSTRESYIYDVVMYIVQNLDKNLNTPDIASQFFVSRDKLNRDFKQYTQMTVKDFVTQTRINLAKSKLTGTKYTIGEISSMCGFENEIYFYSFFKKNTGMTPRQYAEKMKK